jgi:hypothetical protein
VSVENGTLGRVVDDTQPEKPGGRYIGVLVLDGSHKGRVLYFLRSTITPRNVP